ncbi:sodium:calcium antiporter [Nodosilinea nodulosa]|uniref:sodium:calcium antiporter n=1 Tax=Nodosilinea nodulosa TaxID=416001 RepID=UPI0002DC93F8|nr:sodium:calcium antiporter [Nodosilinea nodulosa]
MTILWGLLIVAGIALIIWGAETFAEHLGAAAVRLRVSAFALALLLAGAEPEELATGVTASLRGVPAIAVGDVIGANIAICLVALGVGAWVAPLPFGRRVMRYALFGLPIGILASGFVWNGQVSRVEGIVLVGCYALYVGGIWWAERRPPSLGETGELEEAAEAFQNEQASGLYSWVGQDLLLMAAGLGAIIIGSIVLVEAVRQISQVEATQTKLALTLVGFATSVELVVLAWSTARRGATEATVAAVVGSFTYNVTMTLGAAAVVNPLTIVDATLLHAPILVMLASLALVMMLASVNGDLDRVAGGVLMAAYPLFVISLWLL